MQITEDGSLVPGEINFEQQMKIVMTGSVGPKFTIYIIYIYIIMRIYINTCLQFPG